MMDLSSSDRYSDVFLVEDDDALSLIGSLEALLFEPLRAIATVVFFSCGSFFFPFWSMSNVTFEWVYPVEHENVYKILAKQIISTDNKKQ